MAELTEHALSKEDIFATFDDVYKFSREYIEQKFDGDYLECVEIFRSQYLGALEQIDSYCKENDDAEQFLNELADYIVSREKLEEESIKGKNARAIRNVDASMYTVMYILPALTESGAENLKYLADKIAVTWPNYFGGEPLGIVKSERIAAKFHGNWMNKILKVFKLSD